MDMNPNSLAVTADRLLRYRPRTVQEKAAAFEHAHAALAPGGTLFGATILGAGFSSPARRA